MLALIAFVAAALLAFLQAVEADFGGAHKIDWAVCLIALGLALTLLPGPAYPWRRNPPQ